MARNSSYSIAYLDPPVLSLGLVVTTVARAAVGTGVLVADVTAVVDFARVAVVNTVCDCDGALPTTVAVEIAPAAACAPDWASRAQPPTNPAQLPTAISMRRAFIGGFGCTCVFVGVLNCMGSLCSFFESLYNLQRLQHGTYTDQQHRHHHQRDNHDGGMHRLYFFAAGIIHWNLSSWSVCQFNFLT
jgi:hypothetical protein